MALAKKVARARKQVSRTAAAAKRAVTTKVARVTRQQTKKASKAMTRAKKAASGVSSKTRRTARKTGAAVGKMLGRTIADPDGIEGAPGSSEGLGLLGVETVLAPVKQLRVEQAVHAASGAAIAGYHMHMGVTEGPDRGRPFALVGTEPEGAVSADGRVSGTYLHGLFAADGFRRAWLGNAASPDLAYEAGVEAALDGLAAHLEKHLDINALIALSGEIGP